MITQFDLYIQNLIEDNPGVERLIMPTWMALKLGYLTESNADANPASNETGIEHLLWVSDDSWPDRMFMSTKQASKLEYLPKSCAKAKPTANTPNYDDPWWDIQ